LWKGSDNIKVTDCIISKYISNPLLINGKKFDLRLYVLVTSFDPLRVYLFSEGLVRFSTEIYDLSNINETLSHLTNYSLNKFSSKFVQNNEEGDEEKSENAGKW
jgi:outer membrane lipoprotein-sorting protein